MPLYDLECAKCGLVYEVLVRSRADLWLPKIKCPVCKGSDFVILPSLTAKAVIK